MADDRRDRGSGSLRLRGGIYQARYFHNGHKVEESTKTSDLGKAKRFLRNRLRTAGTPSFVGPQAERVTFADLKAGILHDYTVRKQNRSTKRLKQALVHLEGTFGLDRALAITPERVEAYIDARLEEAEPATVNRELAALRRMFHLAVKHRQLPSPPAIITMLREDNVREGFIEPPDELVAAHEPDVADAVEFAYLTLVRRENTLGLDWTWMTLKVEHGMVTGGTVRLPGSVTKNGQPLTLALQGQLLQVIRRRWAKRIPACPYVFHRNGRRIVRFDAAWDTACAAVGLPGLRFHDLRRSGARNLRRAGVAETVIMRMGGWKTRSMFERYAIVDESDLASAASAYDAFLDRATAEGRKVVSITDAKRTGTTN
ncbi:MAG: site-specific integrase [Deltaproteobacteria bacterium]|nr:MAG: site-specific integrase [Deltaproteobacteria bacterium]